MLQWLVSFLVLLSPGAAFDLRKRFVPVHRFTGLAILSLAFMGNRWRWQLPLRIACRSLIASVCLYCANELLRVAALLTGVLNQQRILPIHESAAAYGNVLGLDNAHCPLQALSMVLTYSALPLVLRCVLYCW